MYGKGLIKGLGITLKHHFGKKMTVQYPEEMPHLYDRFRGHLYLEFEKCIACGMCTRTCPNGVLSLEDARDPNAKKKKLMKYTIDLQYCMFCNLCVEACPQKCLHFDHDFELSKYRREDIKIVYTRPPEMDAGVTEGGSGASASENGAAEAEKKQKQINAMLTALGKNPVKLLSKYVDNEEQAAILAEILQTDGSKANKLVELMVEDREKAKKVAMAFVKKELKQRQANTEGGEGK